MPSLEERLKSGIARYTRAARGNYWTVYALYLVAFAGSVLATALVWTDGGPTILRTALAALPGFVLVINNALEFEKRSAWHWEKTRGLEELLDGLTIRHQPAEDISQQLGKLNREMDAKWHFFGGLPGKPA
jgi:hypothetical protein